MKATIQYTQGTQVITLDCSYASKKEMVKDLLRMSMILKDFKVLA